VNLLDNAIGSIKVGVEDAQSSKHERLLSAVRNIHAGILLLYKEALRRLCPPGSNEVLLKEIIRPKRDAAGAISFEGAGKKTVDARRIEGHFARLGIKTDWGRFKEISDARNELEHYRPTVSKDQLRALISNAYVLVRDFVVLQLHEDPRTLLGEDIWQRMLEVSEVFENERKDCRQQLEAVDWNSDALGRGVLDLECGGCGSALLQPNPASAKYDEVELECRACGEREESESFIPKAIAAALGEEMYLSHTDGDETPYVTCPECFKETYVVAEGRCASCEHEAEHTCERCCNDIPPEELGSSPLCGWCVHMMSKDD